MAEILRPIFTDFGSPADLIVLALLVYYHADVKILKFKVKRIEEVLQDHGIL